MDLDADHYRDHSQEQYQRARALFSSGFFKKDASVLDVGCGDGKITAEVAALIPQGDVLGIDASPSMIHLAKNTFQLPNLEFRCMQAEDIPLTRKFDNILCFSCLLWVRKPKEALNRLAQLLKPQGKLIVLTYLKESAYVDFLEKTLDLFPEYKHLSAARTMLSKTAHLEILKANHLQIDEFSVRDLVSSYETKAELRNYVKGWLNCFVPLPESLQDEFLDRAVENSLAFSVHRGDTAINLRSKSLTIKAVNLGGYEGSNAIVS